MSVLYVIVGVKYDDKHNHIVKVKYLELHDAVIVKEGELSRETVVRMIKGGNLFNTYNVITEEMSPVTLYEDGFIRTKPSPTLTDNLGNLPEF